MDAKAAKAANPARIAIPARAAKSDIPVKAARAAIPAKAAIPAEWKTWAGIVALPAASGYCRTMQFPAHVWPQPLLTIWVNQSLSKFIKVNQP